MERRERWPGTSAQGPQLAAASLGARITTDGSLGRCVIHVAGHNLVIPIRLLIGASGLGLSQQYNWAMPTARMRVPMSNKIKWPGATSRIDS